MLVVLVGLFTRKYLIQGTKIVGESMEPTYLDNQKIFVNKAAINIAHKKPKRGDVVIIQPDDIDDQPQELVIKRIIGLPGEEIEIKPDSSVVINGNLLEEEYLNEAAKNSTYTEHYKTFYFKNLKVKLKDDEYYYMGDNRSNSFDSRNVGPCKYNQILGFAIPQRGKKN